MNLLTFTGKGIYCEEGDFYIDPWQPVKKAVITHAHSDHATYGHAKYLATQLTLPILHHRLGNQNYTGLDYGQTLKINGVNISFHPAGHIIGSAQVRVESKGETWVVSGDYKIHNDGLSTPFEPVRCHHFITESTFGIPAFRWVDPKIVFEQINQWWEKNATLGKTSILSVYALGKAQRILQNVNHDIGPVWAHGAVENMNTILRNAGHPLKQGNKTNLSNHQELARALVLVTPGSIQSSWFKRLKNHSLGYASGWMNLRGVKRRRGVDVGFVLSDHADWDGLIQAIEATGADSIYVTHGYTQIFSRFLNENGWDAQPILTEYGNEHENEVE
ncbi:MAG TPA: ligase-associated DNA damage response exonuclease [Saprospiraceae bacterium]|nr:ligase-associated DNA damage response exonuclease [Saprospiraceae bacterium]